MRKYSFAPHAPPPLARSERSFSWSSSSFVGFLVWLGLRDNEVPTQRIEQDVTNEVLAR